MPDTYAEPLGHGYYWIGSREMADNLQCNPYMLVDGEEAVLFDPGSVLDFEDTAANLASIVPLDRVKYVILHHQDPDLASSVPKFEEMGMKFTVVTHWRTWSLARYYGIKSPVYLVDENDWSLRLGSGKVLRFIPTPYLHFPGAVATYDPSSKFLLSSDLFGAFSHTWALKAGEGYAEGMKAFHEHYMPSKEVLRPVMELLSGLAIDAILPQHGSVIDEDVSSYIRILMDLDCGSMLNVTRASPESAGDYRRPSEKLLQRIAALFGKDTLRTITERIHLGYDLSQMRILEIPGSGRDLWDAIAEQTLLLKGQTALNVLEPLVVQLCAKYSIERPASYESAIQESAKYSEEMGEELVRLRRLNEQLAVSASNVQEGLLRDAITGLYNETYFHNFMDEQAALLLGRQAEEDDVLAVVGIDEGMAQIEYQYGPKEVEAILRGVARILLDSKISNQRAFRLHGATFTYWMPAIRFHDATEICESIRRKVETSKAFIEPVTVSAGMVSIAEIERELDDPANAGSLLTEIGIRRLRIARKRGGNTICSDSELALSSEGKAGVLIVDDDAVTADVIRTFLENGGFSTAIARDGAEALGMIAKEGYDLIISELMIPKVDGFMLKESLARRSGTKDIPFILLSHLKDEKSVVRAYSLGIDHFLKKPFLLQELLGIVRNLLSGRE